MTEKRKKRRICNGICAAAMAFALWGMMINGIFASTVYQTEVLNQIVSESGYEMERWTAFEEEARAAVTEAELPEDVMDWETVRERFLVDLKKEFWGNGAEKSSDWFGELAEEGISTYLQERNIYMPEEAERGAAALKENLQAMKERYTSVPEMENWREEQKNFQDKEGKTSAVLWGILLLSAGLAAGIQHRRSRILDIAGMGGFAGSVLTAATVMTAWWLSMGKTRELSGLLWNRAAETGLLFAAAGAAASVCLWMMGKFFRGVKR